MSNKKINKKTNRAKITKTVLTWCMVLIAMTVVAVGGVEQPDPNGLTVINEAITDGNTAVDTQIPDTANIGIGNDIQSISFKKDISIRDALTFLSAKYQKNIVPSPKVDGQLAFTNLFNVSFEDAMSAILGVDFKYEQKGNLTRVYTAEEYKTLKNDQERLEYRVFTLYHISAAEAKLLITPLKSASGKIESTTAAPIGLPASATIGSSGGGGDTIAMNDTVVVYDFPENVLKIEKVLKQIDIRPKQVLIEATILSATLTEGMKMGIDLNMMAGGTHLSGSTTTPSQIGDTEQTTSTTTTPTEQIADGISGTMAETSGFATIGNGLRIGVRSGNVSAFITALETITDVTLMANPKILAVNKQLGEVYIGQKIGYKSQTTQTQTSTTEDVKFLDTGTKLSFRPYIGDDGYIRMDIHPKDSSGNLNAEGIPNEDSTELSTNILVKDGQTVIIGGLFRDLVSSGKNQIPILGNLPLIGQLFRSNSDSSKRQEVIVMLTCHIINEPEEVDNQGRAEDISRKRLGAKETLNWADRARIAEDSYSKAARYYAEGNLAKANQELKNTLQIRPTYLEAIRLKERILSQTNPDKAAKIERKVLSDIDKKEAPMWMRR